jgi:hypothetical protein
MSYFRQPVFFFTNGKTAAFVLPQKVILVLFLLIHLLKFLLLKKLQTAKNILSNQQTFPQRKAHNSDSIRHQNIEVFYQRTFRVLSNQIRE